MIKLLLVLLSVLTFTIATENVPEADMYAAEDRKFTVSHGFICPTNPDRVDCQFEALTRVLTFSSSAKMEKFASFLVNGKIGEKFSQTLKTATRIVNDPFFTYVMELPDDRAIEFFIMEDLVEGVVYPPLEAKNPRLEISITEKSSQSGTLKPIFTKVDIPLDTFNFSKEGYKFPHAISCAVSELNSLPNSLPVRLQNCILGFINIKVNPKNMLVRGVAGNVAFDKCRVDIISNEFVFKKAGDKNPVRTIFVTLEDPADTKLSLYCTTNAFSSSFVNALSAITSLKPIASPSPLKKKNSSDDKTKNGGDKGKTSDVEETSENSGLHSSNFIALIVGSIIVGASLGIYMFVRTPEPTPPSPHQIIIVKALRHH